MLTPQQLHLGSLMRSTGKVAGDINPMSFQRRNSTALQLSTSNTDNAHFLRDTTSLLRDATALPKWKQQLLSLPSVLSSCLCVFYCQVSSNSPFEMTKLHKLWRDRKTNASHLSLLEAWFGLPDISALGFCIMLSGVFPLQAISFPCQRCVS